MERGKNKIKLVKWGVVCFFVLFQAYLIFIDKHLTLDINASPNTNPTPHITNERIISQTFTAQRDNLAKIEVMLGTFDRKNDRDVIFELGIPGKRAVLQETFNASDVKNNLYHSIRFSPQKKSKGKTYYFSLSSPESTLRNSICAWMNSRDIYRKGEYFLNGRAQGGDLVFRAYSLQPVSAVLGKLNRKYPGVLGSPVVLILFLALFLIIQIVVLVKLMDLLFQSVGSFMKKSE